MLILYIVAFAILALSSRQIGQLFARLRLPLISGYLVAGILIGPFGLKFISSEAIPQLRFIDEIALAYIAFAAGSELYLNELKSRFKSIAWVTGMQLISTFALGSIAVFLLSDLVPFMQDMPVPGRIGVSLLAGAILVARSPSSAIAIVNELRARGPFTKMVLGVIIVMDVIVIILFALSSSAADALLTDVGFNVMFVVLVLGEILLSFLIGCGVALILRGFFSMPLHLYVKAGLSLLTGFAVFLLSTAIRTYTHEYLPFEILLEPLLICMIGSFLLTNFTQHRAEFITMLHDVAPPIYVAFFTLTGASLALDTLLRTWPLTVALFGARLLGIFTGSFAGGVLAGDPMPHNRNAWLTFVTQAGVGIGLAKGVAVEFPAWGGEFATLIISVIVLNQLVGPPLFKMAINNVGEAHVPVSPKLDEVRDALILGIERQSLELARLLKAHNWQVIMADTDPTHVEKLAAADVEERLIDGVTPETMSNLVTNATDALVALLDDDAENYRACELAYERFGIPRLVVRLHDPAWAGKFRELGALVVDPASAMVNLLDQAVRSPQSAELLLHTDPNTDVSQITVTDPDVVGIPLRDLRLPDDVVILSIRRGKQTVVPHGYTVLQLYDEVVVVGRPESLEEVTRRFGF